MVCARLLSEEEFGGFGLIQSTLSMFGAAAGLSLGLAATRYIALYRRSEPSRVRRVSAVILVMGTGSIVLTSVILATIAGWLANHVMDNPSLETPLRWAAIQLVCWSVYGIAGGMLSGLERFGLLGLTAGLQNLGILVGSVLLIPWLRLTGAIMAQAVGGALALVVGLAMVWPLLSGTTWRSLWADLRAEHAIFLEFCLPSLLANFAIFPATWGAAVLVTRQPGGYAELGFFTAADRFRLLLLFAAGFVSTAFLPVLAGAIGNRDGGRGEERRTVELALIGTSAMVVPLTCLFAFGGPTFMAVFGRSYSANWAVLLPIIAWGGMGAIGSIIGTALLAHGRQWFLLLSQAVYGLVVIGLTYGLRTLGGQALAFGHLGGVLTVVLITYPFVRALGMLTARATRVWLGQTAVVGLICTLSWFCPGQWRIPLGVGVTAGACAVVFVLFTAAERARLLAFARRYLRFGSQAA